VEVREKLRMISRLAGSEPFRQLEICKVGSAIYAEKSFIVVQNVSSRFERRDAKRYANGAEPRA
jgi:hypothetical protein